MEWWEMIIDFGLIAGMLFVGIIGVILTRSKRSFTKQILSVFFINTFFFLLYYYSYLHRIKTTGAIAVLFAHGVGYLLGPSYLYLLKSLVFPKERILKSYLKSLIPFTVVFICFNIPLFISMAFGYLNFFHQWYIQHEVHFNLIENGYLIIYMITTLILHNRLKILFKENYSNLSSQNLDWYRHFIVGFIFIVAFDSLLSLYERFYAIPPWNVGTIIAFLIVFLYLYLGYKGVYQPQILMPDFLLDKLSGATVDLEGEKTTSLKDTKKITRQLDSFTEVEISHLKEKLDNSLTCEKVFLDEDLSLTSLAENLGITNKKLSELLNHHLNTDFYNIINQFRVDEVKRRFHNGDLDKYTILAIANESGFKSKASFYRIFKQKEGMSPSNYCKKILPEKALL